MNSTPHPAPSFSLADAYHLLFRHKGKILTMVCLSLAGATAAYFKLPSTYQSEAKLFINFVMEPRPLMRPAGPKSAESEPVVRSPENNVVNSEMEILTSRDLAEQVANALGPEKILGSGGPLATRERAAVAIGKSLKVEAPSHSAIIRVVFQHGDPATAQQVVKQLVTLYREKHLQIHRPSDLYYQYLTKETDSLRGALAKTDLEIHRLRNTNGFGSIEEARKAYVAEIARIRQELSSAEVELAENRAALPVEIPGLTNAATNAVARGVSNAPATLMPSALGTNVAVNPLTADQVERIEAYADLRAKISAAQSRETELLTQYTELYPPVLAVRNQLSELKKRKEAMERETPSLLLLRGSGTAAVAQSLTNSMAGQLAKAMSLQAKITVLNSQLEKLRAEALGAEETESRLAQLKEERKRQEADYNLFKESLDQSVINTALGPGHVSNIGDVEVATAPVKVPGIRKKVIGGILAVGTLGSLVLAYLLEFMVDQSVKRPAEVEHRLRLPFLLWIPDLRHRGARRRLGWPPANGRGLLTAGDAPPAALAGQPPSPPKPGETAVAPWHPEHDLRAYYEALRDRLVTYFEVRNMSHKPKLVGITGCSKGVGVSSIATGLAAVLSETGDGNVLLVDLNAGKGNAHPFYRGKPGCGLQEALQGADSHEGEVQNRLFLATPDSADAQLPQILPRTFVHLVPRLKASDYDFIIFDMPPVNQTSATPRLAGHMDMTLLVIEAEKDHLEVIRKAAASLQEAKANVGTLLNKKRTYVPPRLAPEV
jgi:polysaccharide biosynthesis transport protein